MFLKLFVIFLFIPSIANAAITFVSIGTRDYTGSGTCFPQNPPNIQANDILILTATSDDQLTHTATNGYTEIIQGNGGGTDQHTSMWWKRTNGTESQSSITRPGGGSTIICGITAFRGVEETGSPVDVASSAVSGNCTSTLTVTGITTTVSGDAIFMVMGNTLGGNAMFSNEGPIVTTELFDNWYTPEPYIHHGAAWGIQSSSGATGNQTATIGTAACNSGAIVALKPEGAPSAPPPSPGPVVTVPYQEITFCNTACDAEKHRNVSQSYTLSSTAARTCHAENTVTVPGANQGDECQYADTHNLLFYPNCWVSAVDTVKLRWCNTSDSTTETGASPNIHTNIFKSGGIRSVKEIDLPVLSAKTCQDNVFDLKGARDGMACVASVPTDIVGGLNWFCWVNAVDKVTLRVCNIDDISSGNSNNGVYSVRLMHTRNGWGKTYDFSNDFSSIVAGGTGTVSWNIPSASGDGEVTYCGIPNSAVLGELLYKCWSDAPNTVRITVHNIGTVSRDPPLSVFSVSPDR